MGMFDEVHTGTRCGQTKALGKSGAAYAPGDTVRCFPAPMDEESYEAYLRGELVSVADDFQVAMHEGGFLTVRGARLVDWVDQREEDLPLYDNHGRPVADASALGPDYLYTSRPELELPTSKWARREALSRRGLPYECQTCDLVAAGQLERWRAERRAQMRARCEEAERRRAHPPLHSV